MYKRVRPEQLHDDQYSLDELNSTPYVIITEEEYDALLTNSKPKCLKRNVSSLTKKIIASNWYITMCLIINKQNLKLK